MLNNATIVTTVPAVDLARAKDFYQNKLGLAIEFEEDQGVMLRTTTGSQILLYPRGATTADHTVCSFEVADIGAAVAELRGKGITFEEYDFPGLKTENGIASIGDQKAAWFKDTEGNILAVGESMK